MGDELHWARIAPNSPIIGKTYVAMAKNVAVQIDAAGVTEVAVQDGIWIYDQRSFDLEDPFMKLPGGQTFKTSGPLSGAFYGMPLNDMFCWVTFEMNANYKIEVLGMTSVWFEPVGSGELMYWNAKAIRGFEYILAGCCPFAPPGTGMDRRYEDLGVILGPCQFCFDGFSMSAPVLAINAIDIALGPSGIGTPYVWQVDFQSCDLSGDDENLEPGDGPASPWNVLGRDCCARTGEGGDGETGQGDTETEPPPPTTCSTNNIFCKVICKKVQPGGLGGNPVNVWCYPTENGRLTDYCVTDSGAQHLTCGCSNITVAGNVLPDPNTVVPGTLAIVKCENQGGLGRYQDCNNYQGA